MKDENKTHAPVAEAAPAAPVAPKASPKPAPKPRDPYIRAENEDDDGYDPYSDRRKLTARGVAFELGCPLSHSISFGAITVKKLA